MILEVSFRRGGCPGTAEESLCRSFTPHSVLRMCNSSTWNLCLMNRAQVELNVSEVGGKL